MLRAAIELTLAILSGAAASWGVVALLVLYDRLAFGWPRIEAEASTMFPAFVPRPRPTIPAPGPSLAAMRRRGVAPAGPARVAGRPSRLRA